jgi:DNA polymerase III sliding clamp (beta) subunit (PCNA family)
MRLAMRIVNPEHPNPVVRGIYLDAGGSVVATDGHRLFRATAPGLASLAAPLVLAPVAQRELPVADGAVLSIDSNEAILRFPDGNGCTFPVCDDAYVPYEKVISQDAPIRASVSADDLLEALGQLADHLEARHPVEPDGDWKYLPAVLVRLAADQPSLQLVTAREIGYVPREPGSEAQGSPVRSPVDWKFSVTIAAEVVLAEGTFGIALDFRYLCDAVESLSGTLDLAFASKTDPVVLRSRDDPERLAVIMPMAQRA